MTVNLYILVPLVAWFIAQWIKFSIAAFKDDINFRYLYASGGMPSVHSAVVTSLFVTTLLQQGSSSPLTGITAVVAAIVIYDSLGVRRSTGEQAIVLNGLVDGLEEHKISFNSHVSRVREVLGHQPNEVFWGMVLGGLVAVLGSLDRLSKQFAFLAATPKGAELAAYTVVLVLGLVAVIVMLVVYAKRFKKAASQSGRLLAWLTLIGFVVGLFIALAQYEKVAVIGARWVLYVVAGLLAIMMVYVVKTVRGLPVPNKSAEIDRKARWLEKGKKKKRKN